jgi:glycine/D-amino acid oxidase-like deaminating enzyme
MRKLIIPTRGTISAQKPPKFLRPPGDTPSVTWSYTFNGEGFHYLTQLPTAGAELIVGGGVINYGDEPSVVDDGHCNPEFAAHLASVIPELFSKEADADVNGVAKDYERDGDSKGRELAVWSGIFALSADRIPWVGRLPTELTGREAPVDENKSLSGLAAPGEWLSGGYCGEGMVYAWRCGQAVAHMVLGKEVDWLPEAMLITEKRWSRVSFQ